MAGAIGDMNQGLVGISHTTGTQHSEIPAKKMVKPSAGSNITIHTDSALNLEDSGNHLMKFIRGSSLDSYSPQEQKDLRTGVLENIGKFKKDEKSKTTEETNKDLLALESLLKNDEELENMAMMARNVLISA